MKSIRTGLIKVTSAFRAIIHCAIYATVSTIVVTFFIICLIMTVAISDQWIIDFFTKISSKTQTIFAKCFTDTRIATVTPIKVAMNIVSFIITVTITNQFWILTTFNKYIKCRRPVLTKHSASIETDAEYLRLVFSFITQKRLMIE